MEFDIDRLIKMIEREMLSPVMLTSILLWFAREDRSGLEKLLEAMSPKDLDWVYDILTMYPVTAIGWSILPASRAEFLKPDLERGEAADVDRRQYQEDRTRVEYLRGLIRP